MRHGRTHLLWHDYQSTTAILWALLLMLAAALVVVSPDAGGDARSWGEALRDAGMLMLFFAVVAGVAVSARVSRIARLLREGGRVTGTVEEARAVFTYGNLRFDCRVVFRYEVGGQEYRGEAVVGSRRLGGLERGRSVTVCYDALRPGRAVLADAYGEA